MIIAPLLSCRASSGLRQKVVHSVGCEFVKPMRLIISVAGSDTILDMPARRGLLLEYGT